MVAIEKMQKEDWAAVSRIYLEGIQSNVATLETELPSFEDWDKVHLKEGRFVAKNQEIVGFIALSPVSNRKAYSGVMELSIYMDGAYRGMGIATRLMEAVIEWADNHNVWTLQVTILEENEGSIQFHEKCGFRKVGYRDRIGKDSFGNWRNTVLMERRSGKIGFEGCDMANCPMKHLF